ncbi:TSUP family transporter [Solirubrobacter sp. CPCC 204708]|uniref:Probable membrane transporter protein n=1 Tax=Solirubrobacter deserti TaxID=2282478 RepID=A0ABT4RMQ2_9ACTN|nr:TSUP family transporter [Solirubrobacter deserti]MBE2320129.1 TSUP family transporter [Solirubrobacter deserti]MDA0139849.1 TSUP family transporter [Solirubrobacter deserti]
MLLAAACVSVFVGTMLQAATGFGFSLVAAPLVFAAVGAEPAVVLLLLLGLEVNLLTLMTEHRTPQPLKRAAVVILLFAVPGAFAGVVALRALPEVALQVAVTLGVLATLLARRITTAHIPPSVAGLAAGALTTTTSTNGPPILLHLLGRGAPPEQVRDTLTVCFIGLAALGAFALVSSGDIVAPDGALVLGLLPAVVVAHLIGRRGFTRLAASPHYERVLTGVMLVAVVVGLIGALS